MDARSGVVGCSAIVYCEMVSGDWSVRGERNLWSCAE